MNATVPKNPACGVEVIRLDQLIRNGVVADQAKLARLGHVTRARLTQLMNLLCLAPNIQEEFLHLSRIEQGREQ